VRDAGFPDTGIYYPICETREKYESQSGKKTKGMPPAAKRAIDNTQPYGGGNDALWGLHQLSIRDKHKLLILVGHKIGTFSIPLSPEAREITFAFPAPFEEGAILGALPGEQEANQHMQFAFDIELGEPPAFAGYSIGEIFGYLVQMVKAIVAHSMCETWPRSHAGQAGLGELQWFQIQTPTC
jgi:hypothetical protein